MTREERIAALRALIERQMEARKKAEHDIVEIDEAMRRALAEYLALVAPGPEVRTRQGE